MEKMTKAEAGELAKEIARRAPGCRVQGLYKAARAHWAVHVINTESCYLSFLVYSPTDWEERCRTGRLY